MRATVATSILTFLLLSGCGIRSIELSDAKIAKNFLNGVSPSALSDFHYICEGNHAGYSFIARAEVDSAQLARITSGARDWGQMSPRTAEEGGSRPSDYMKSVGDWYQLDWDQSVQVWRSLGSNDYTGSFLHYFYLSPDGRTLYIHAHGT